MSTQMSKISRDIWNGKYRLKTSTGTPVDKTVDDTFRRVAKALACPEVDPSHWEEQFYRIMEDFKFMPAGRILSGAGAERDVTLFNCFVMGDIPDSMRGIFDSLKEAALTMQQGGGIGYDFSTLRPNGSSVEGVGADASGPLSFMDVWDAMCRTIMSAGSRRGAMMAVIRCDHPDVVDFIEAKQEAGRLRMFNLSVLVTDAFMEAVSNDDDWDLIFAGTVYNTVKARDLWDRIMRGTFACAEPGVIFIDRINKANNLSYCETIHGTNPCGEQPLPPYGACLLGSVNLARFVEEPFAENARINVSELADVVRTAVRLMDNVIDVSRFPLEAQAHEARAKRRIGLGVTGLADALIMCGVRYGAPGAVKLTEQWMSVIEDAAYRASIGLASEKGAFPLLDVEKYLAGGHVSTLTDLHGEIRENGIRNALLTSVAPTGTISLFADNVSSGLEPVFALEYTRRVLQPDGSSLEETVSDYAYRLFKRLKGDDCPLPAVFVTAEDLSPSDHIRMQAAVQRHIDSSISKTINVPENIAFDDFKSVYREAYDSGCKGCTTYRPNDVTGAVLSTKADDKQEDLPLGLDPVGADSVGGVVHHLMEPLDRPEALPGATYKLNWPESDHAIYITLNDIVQDGRRRPFEVFINSKNMEHYAWTVGLTRMVSAVFRRGGDVSFVFEELKAVFDPRGGQWMGGKYIPSLLAAIGNVIEEHMRLIGFLATPAGQNIQHNELKQVVNGATLLPTCPKCSQPSLVKQSGCDTCTSCGYSKCG